MSAPSDLARAAVADESVSDEIAAVNGMSAVRAEIAFCVSGNTPQTIQDTVSAMRAITEKAVSIDSKILQLRTMDAAITAARGLIRGRIAELLVERDKVDDTADRVVRDNLGYAHWDDFNNDLDLARAETTVAKKTKKRAKKISTPKAGDGASNGATLRRSAKRRQREEAEAEQAAELAKQVTAQRAIVGDPVAPAPAVKKPSKGSRYEVIRHSGSDYSDSD